MLLIYQVFANLSMIISKNNYLIMNRLQLLKK